MANAADMHIQKRKAAAFDTMITHGLQYHPPLCAHPEQHVISNRYGEFIEWDWNPLGAVEKARVVLEGKV